jgi:LmbE family N-acetylglucosaminyl deacetylase
MSVRAGRMLVVSPHADDETLGPGGTIARFVHAGGEVTVLTVTGDLPPVYPPGVWEMTVDESRLAHAILGVKRSIFWERPAVTLGQVPVYELNHEFLKVVEEVAPDIVLVPFYDRHVDHRLAFESAMVALRPVGPGKDVQMVAAYETLSETHWNAPAIEPGFVPNWSVDITDEIDVKLDAMRCYQSAIDASPIARSVDAVRSLALFRGSQVGVGFAEAFHVIRMTAPPELLA